ncbi:MAG: hypothetical protein D6679_11770 [Candidatus Hydrogenedentota bacterium]|nr:MAG: hypothetical protein D6679_11770 [Candidatus Hydrogenedentota bacterium]
MCSGSKGMCLEKDVGVSLSGRGEDGAGGARRAGGGREKEGGASKPIEEGIGSRRGGVNVGTGARRDSRLLSDGQVVRLEVRDFVKRSIRENASLRWSAPEA